MTRQLTLILIFVETTLLNSQAKIYLFVIIFILFICFFFVQAVLGNDPLETYLI